MSDLQALETSRSAPNQSDLGKSRPARSRKNQISKDWTIKGLPAEAVEVARDAARESGMKINAWVANVFEQAAQERLPTPSPAREVELSHYLNADDEIRRLRARNEELFQTVSNLSQALAKLSR